MCFTAVLTALAGLTLTPALAARVTYDPVYDNKSNSLSIVACSNGANGLLTKGYTTFGSLKNFPNIGGAQAVAGWNSPNCGTCWQLIYKNKSIFVVAIDHADDGFNISEEAMNTLTNGQAEDLGVIEVISRPAPASSCKL